MVRDLLIQAFNIPLYLGIPGGDYWPLQQSESADLSKALKKAFYALPPASRKFVTKYLENYAPLLLLLVTGGTILYPRVVITLSEAKKSGRKTGPDESIPPTGTASGSGTGNGTLHGVSNQGVSVAPQRGETILPAPGSPRAVYYDSE